MSTPLSLTPSPVTSLGDHSFKSLLDDDYGVNKLTLKAKCTSPALGVFNFKGAYDYVKDSGSQEVKVQFPYKRFYFWLGVRPDDQKLHIDLGEFTVIKRLRYYANVRNFASGPVIRFGAVHNGQRCQSHTRLEYQNDNYSLTSRAYVVDRDFVGAFAGTYNFTTNTPTRYDALIGYVKPDIDVFLRHYTNSRRLSLGRLVADVVYRRTPKNTFGVETELNEGKNPTVTVGAAYLVNGFVLKGKANLRTQDVFVSLKGKVADKWLLTLGAQLPMGNNYKNPTNYPVPLGITLETAI